MFGDGDALGRGAIFARALVAAAADEPGRAAEELGVEDFDVEFLDADNPV